MELTASGSRFFMDVLEGRTAGKERQQEAHFACETQHRPVPVDERECIVFACRLPATAPSDGE